MKVDQNKKNDLKRRLIIYILLGALLIFLAIFFGARIISGLANTDGEIISQNNGDTSENIPAVQNMSADQSVKPANKYTANKTVSYTVTYIAGQHGTLSADKLSRTTESVAKGKTPDSVPLVNAEDGYSFAGWYKDSGSTLIDSGDIADLKIQANTIFTAQYTHIPYEVSFDLAGCGTSTDTLTFDLVYYGDTIVVPAVTENPGWIFTGWDTTPSTTVTGSAVYTAQYTHILYEVSFDLGGYGTSEDTLTFDSVYYGDTIVVPTVTANPGWIFIGWDTTPSTTVTESIVYTALYQLNRVK